MISLIPLIMLSGFVLPNVVLITLGIPFSQLDHMSFLSFRSIDVRVYDLLVVIIALKVGCSFAISKRKANTSLYWSIGVYLIVLMGATALSYRRFGLEVFNSEMIAFLRFLVLFVVFFLTVYSITTAKQLNLADHCFDIFGYVAAFSVYLGLVLFMVGIEFGEVSSGNVVRSFGIFGDQVGFILPLFLYKELLCRRKLRASFFGVATLLTGTRGALVTLVIGTVCLYLFSRQGKDFLKQHYKKFSAAVVVGGVIAVASSYDLGGIQTRFKDREIFTQGLTTRVTTFTIAAEICLDNLLTGVGFSGFRLVASDYEANAYTPAIVATTANQYLQVATDAGVVGLIAFLWLMKRCLQTLKKAQAVASLNLQRSLGAAYIWLWSLLIGAQTVAWLLPDMTLSYILWIIMGMATASTTIKDPGTLHAQPDASYFAQGVR